MDSNSVFPRVLIVSHNAFSMTNNMGKTLASYFSSFPKECLAQLYFHEGIPHSNICNRYYSFSDKDALHSIFNRLRKGVSYNSADFDESTPSIVTGTLYAAGKTKKPIVSFGRDLVWFFSNWKNKKLIAWIKDFSPDVIFFASGDYCFSYRIAITLSKLIKIPLSICFFDDYYTYCTYENRFLGKTYFKHFMKVARKAVNESKSLFTVNELMRDEYRNLFNKSSYVLYTAAQINDSIVPYSEKKEISYIGGLSLNRHVPLVEIGRLLKAGIDGLPDHINVYSAETRPEILSVLTRDNGIVFKGAIGPSEVKSIIKSSLAVLHVESFDENNRRRTRLSLSTKIAESLGSGTVLVAYGPLELASMQYLNSLDAAIVSDNPIVLKKRIKEILTDEEKYNTMSGKAMKAAMKNHSIDSIKETILSGLNNAME